MIISWYGHSCFKIQTRPQRGSDEVAIFTDPFDKSIGLKPPQGNADIVLVSHSHSDHNNTETIKGDPFVVDALGEYSIKNIFIEGISSYHDNQEGSLRGLNNIYTIRSEDLVVCHLGDLGHTLNEDQIEDIGDVDILMIPIGGKYTLESKEVEKVISQIDPKIILPMHYKIPNLKLDINGKEEFTKELGLEMENGTSKLNIKASDLKDVQNKVIFMNID
jgi:L-ascorbate metabolism protein UlaG (beta-lactamase superfamily)